MQSMTGFARTTKSAGNANIVWETRSVNGRNLDLRFHSTIAIDTVEYELRKKAGEVFSRGNITCSLNVIFETGDNHPVINQDYLDWVLKLSAELEKTHGIQKPTIDGLLGLKGVLEYGTPTDETLENDVLKTAIIETYENALQELRSAREHEGNSLKNILSGQVDKIENLVSKARNDPCRSQEAIKERLKTLVESLIVTSDKLDPQRLETEAVLIATKVDVQEELDRLDEHVKAARYLLALDEPVGRRLDFLAQEFNREANTLCSKAHTASLSAAGLSLKTVIDQFREQLQNVE